MTCYSDVCLGRCTFLRKNSIEFKALNTKYPEELINRNEIFHVLDCLVVKFSFVINKQINALNSLIEI